MEINIEEEAQALDLPEAEASDTIKDLTTRYRHLKDFEELCDHKRKKAKSERESLDQLLYDKMMEEGIEKLSTDLGSFKPVKVEQCSIIAGFETAAFEILEFAGLGASIKRTVNWQTLNKHYREGEFVVPEGSDTFKTWSRKTVAMRRINVPRHD